MPKAFSTPQGLRKVCCRCHGEFSLDLFHKSNQTSDGLNGRCATCQSAAVQDCMARKVARGEPKITEAQKARALERKAGYYQANPEKHRQRSADYRSSQPKKAQASVNAARQKRPDHWRAYARAYYHDNAATIRPRQSAQTMKRYASKVKAIPAWCDPDAIAALYVEAARITAETGVPHDVDHIVPIISKTVCGLHVHHNLRVLEKSANRKKGNRHWPDMP